MSWLLMSLITALIILIHERNHNHPVEKWASEDYILFITAVTYWPFGMSSLCFVTYWPKLQCSLGRHQFLVNQVLDKDSKRVICSNCRKSYLIIGSKPPILWSRRTDKIYG